MGIETALLLIPVIGIGITVAAGVGAGYTLVSCVAHRLRGKSCRI